MTKPMKHAIGLMALVMLAGCSDIQPVKDSTLLSLNEWTDPSTGCVYYVWRQYQMGGMTAKLRKDGTPECPYAPRLNPDGTQVCTQKEQTHESD